MILAVEKGLEHVLFYFHCTELNQSMELLCAMWTFDGNIAPKDKLKKKAR
jgi:hypothetical protein